MKLGCLGQSPLSYVHVGYQKARLQGWWVQRCGGGKGGLIMKWNNVILHLYRAGYSPKCGLRH